MNNQKLKKPITITIEYVAEAVLLTHFYNHPTNVVRGQYGSRDRYPLLAKLDSNNCWPWLKFDEISSELEKHGIDWTESLESKPKPSITLGEYAVEWLEDGVKVGCTKVTKEQVAAIYNELHKESHE